LLDQLHRDNVTRTQANSPRLHTLRPMRPYAEQLAFERGED